MEPVAKLSGLERAAPAPGRWHHKPEPGENRRPRGEREIVFGCIAWATVDVLLGSSGLLPTTPFLVALGAPLALLLVWSIATYPSLRATTHDLGAVESPEDADVCLVRITVVVKDETIGSDRGVSWFEGGRLLFSGHATSFDLGGQDVMPRDAWRDRYRLPIRRQNPNENHFDAALLEDAIPLRLLDRWAYVLFEPLQGVGGAEEAKRMRFLAALHDFRLRPPRPSSEPRQWPPLESYTPK